MKRFIILIAFLLPINNLLLTQPNQWVDAGNMIHARESHTATLLQNGKVLVVGWDSNVAELYDAESDTFLTTGSTNYNHRQGATATLLNDGKVLIVGGVNALNIAELYDPQTGTFQLIDTLNTVHAYHTATLLKNGHVLIAGGQDQSGPETHAVCEIYDPLTKKFLLTDTLNVHRSSHEAVLLQNGQVLIAGGLQTTSPGIGMYLSSCELFDPASGTFTLTQSLNQPRIGHQASMLKSGKVLVTCGAWYQRYGEIYDPVSNAWSLTGDMTVMRRNYQTATILHNGKVFLAGGYIDTSTPTAEIYDPEANTFAAIDSMKVARMNHTATRLLDGSVLVTGGYSKNGAVNSAERYIVDTNDVVSVKEENVNSQNIPEQFQLFQNYPNPFNPITKISWQSPVGNWQTLKIFNVLGKEVVTLVDEYKSAGKYEVTFSAKGGSAYGGDAHNPDKSGQVLPSGNYFYKLQAGSFVETKKMTLLR